MDEQYQRDIARMSGTAAGVRVEDEYQSFLKVRDSGAWEVCVEPRSVCRTLNASGQPCSACELLWSGGLLLVLNRYVGAGDLRQRCPVCTLMHRATPHGNDRLQSTSMSLEPGCVRAGTPTQGCRKRHLSCRPVSTTPSLCCPTGSGRRRRICAGV